MDGPARRRPGGAATRRGTLAVDATAAGNTTATTTTGGAAARQGPGLPDLSVMAEGLSLAGVRSELAPDDQTALGGLCRSASPAHGHFKGELAVAGVGEAGHHGVKAQAEAAHPGRGGAGAARQRQ
jgi:hypothetical protein